jgi:glycosyltransferase involved in cell wall biosynthesis
MTAALADSPHPDTTDGQVDVSVLVPVLNEERHIRESVDAMRRQRFDGSIELLFADGRSEDRTREILEELARADPRIRVFDNPERRTPSGLNVCLRHARGEYVARMDAHSFYPETYLAAGVERLRRGDTDWVSGPAVPRPSGRVGRAIALALGTPLGQGGSRKWTPGAEERELDTGVFAGVWRRRTVLDYGGWDEGWPQNQDSEMAARFIGDGRRLILLPEMAAEYVPRDSLKGVFRQYRNYGLYRIRTARRHPHSMRRSHVIAPAIALMPVAALVAPRPLRGLARLGVALYTAALGASAVPVAREHGVQEAALVPAALAAMQLGGGVGVLEGVRRFGVPWPALAWLAGWTAPAERGTKWTTEPVHAPSLDGA